MDYNVDHEEKERIRRQWEEYRKRSATATAVAVTLYILCVLPLIVLGLFGDVWAVVGLCLMFLMIAAATGILVWVRMSKPVVTLTPDGTTVSAEDGEGEKQEEKDSTERKPAFRIINGVLWGVTICGYVSLSLHTGAWHVTWLMFIIAIALEQVIKAVFDLCSKD